MHYTIYAIQNKVNKKIYVGKTSNPQSRFKKHISDLKSGNHIVEDMQEDYNKFGDVFEIFVLEEGVTYHDCYLEYKYMKKYRSCEREYGYNYKDHIAQRTTFDKPCELACKTEAEIIPPFDSVKTEYISEIIERLNKIDDISLFDLVLQVLHKASESEN